MTDTRAQRSRTVLAVTLAVTMLAGILGLFFPTATALGMSPDKNFEKCLRDKHNAARKSAGLAPLESRSEMVTFARKHTAVMIKAGKLSHSDNLGAATSGWTKLAENVGVGGGCDSLHNAFMKSAGHKANVLGKYTSIGVGGGVGNDGRMYVTVVFAAHKKSSPTTTTTPSAPTTSAPEKKKTTTTAAAKTPTTSAAPTTTTTAPSLELPGVNLETLVGDMIRIALESCLPVRLAVPRPDDDQPTIIRATS